MFYNKELKYDDEQYDKSIQSLLSQNYKNWETTEQFLKDHGIMTSGLVNGFKFYFATQKCVRTKSFENATIEYVEVQNSNINKAIEYQEMSGDMVPMEIMTSVLCKLMKLTGTLKTYFEKVYPDFYETLKENNKIHKSHFHMKYAILGTLREMKEVKKVGII